jgi:hypothetical protein
MVAAYQHEGSAARLARMALEMLGEPAMVWRVTWNSSHAGSAVKDHARLADAESHVRTLMEDGYRVSAYRVHPKERP